MVILQNILTRVDVTHYTNICNQIWTRISVPIQRWRLTRSTRRRLLMINERSLRDIGLEHDEVLRYHRERFRR